MFTSNSTDEKSREWRAEIAYRALILIRTAMAVVDYPVTKAPAWGITELKGIEREDAQQSTYLNPKCRRWSHGEPSEFKENLRVPVRITYLLKKTIHAQSTRLAHPMA